MDYRYFYLLWSLVFFLLWAVFFWYRRDLRRSMSYISILFGIGGVVSQFIYISDWWQPLTITGTRVGPEDFLIGFSIAGIAVAAYKTLLGLSLERKDTDTVRPYARVFLLGFVAVFFGMFFLSHSSLYASLVPYVLGTACIWYVRRDLIAESLWSGLFLLIIGSLIYYLMLVPFPDFVQRFWYIPDVWYARTVIGIPLAEYIWFFATGVFIGPLYEFLRDYRLVLTLHR